MLRARASGAERRAAQFVWPIFVIASACGGVPAARAPRFAVVPEVWRTEGAEDVHASEALVEGMREGGLADASSAEGACGDDIECLRHVGESTGADRVLSLGLAALGSTVLLRADVVDVDAGTREQSRQRIVPDASGDAIRAAARSLGAELARPFAPLPEVPWYEQWWPWTIAGVAVAIAVGVSVGVVLGSSGGPDIVVRPP